MNKTSNDYCIAVKQKYEQEKSKKYSGFLFDPTPSLLKELCLILFEAGLKKKDKEVFESFFTPKAESNLKNTIERFDGEKLRPVCNFLKGTSKKTNSTILNLIAVLVDFDARPFAYFVLGNEINTQDAVDNEESDNLKHPEKETNNNEKNEKEKSTSNFLVVNEKRTAETMPSVIQNRKITQRDWKKIAGIGLGSIAAISFGYTAKNMIFPEKECMKWCEDHYELVDCIDEKIGLANYEIIKPYDEVEFQRKKLKVCDTTCFFKNKKAVIWYDKEDDQLRCFNMDGYDPVTGDQLHQITPHMVNKYVLNNR